MISPCQVDPEESVRDYWQRRLRQHFGDRYRGRALLKLPEDLRTYQHVIEASRPEVIVELGMHDGGSALWFADQLTALCGGGRVITIDHVNGDPPVDDRITFICGDLRDVAERVKTLTINKTVMVVEDSAHDHTTTAAALRLYEGLVQKGHYFVVEDTIVDTALSIWPEVKGALTAVDEFLPGSRFERRDLSLYGLTMYMGGWLEAVR